MYNYWQAANQAGAAQAQAMNAPASAAGMDWGGIGAGFQMGNSLGNMYGAYQAHKDQMKDMRAASETSAAIFRQLLGSQIGNQVGRGTDVVGGPEDPRSRYLQTGTVISSNYGGGGMNPLAARGGINPLVLQARQRLYNAISRPQFGAAYRNAMAGGAARELGGQLNQIPGNVPAQQALMAMLQPMGAGQSAAQISMGADANARGYANQAAQQGLAFLNALYQQAGGSF